MALETQMDFTSPTAEGLLNNMGINVQVMRSAQDNVHISAMMVMKSESAELCRSFVERMARDKDKCCAAAVRVLEAGDLLMLPPGAERSVPRTESQLREAVRMCGLAEICIAAVQGIKETVEAFYLDGQVPYRAIAKEGNNE